MAPSSTSTADSTVLMLVAAAAAAGGPKVSFAAHPYPINGQPIENLTTPSSASERFAVIEFSGTQYKVTLDDTIVADKQAGVDIGQVMSLGNVLMKRCSRCGEGKSR